MKQNSIHCEIDMIPPRVTYQMHRIAFNSKTHRPYTYRTAKQIEACNQIETALKPYIPEQPLTGPIEVMFEVRFPHNKSSSKAEKEKLEVPMTTRPDIDNVWKQWGDILTRLGFWEDDSQIVQLTLRKVKSSRPGVTLHISQY